MNEDKGKKIAIIRIRSIIGIRKDVEYTLKMLKLYKKNYCVVLDDNPSTLGMINKVKDYITWGEIDDKTYKLLIDKRGDEFKGLLTDKKRKVQYKKFFMVNNKKYKPFFRLSPPRKGFGRKGIKISFKAGGALGYRGDKINELIKRMI